MERTEPSLVPEWLRSTSSVSGGGNSTHHCASSSSYSDVSSSIRNTRNKNSKSISDNSPRSAFLNRSSPSDSRRSSNNGSAKHAYSSFGRSHRDKDRKDRDRDKERSGFGDHWDRDDSLGSILVGRNGKDTLQRSQSLLSRKQSEVLPQRVAVDLKSNSTYMNGNGLIYGGSAGSKIQKAVFEKDFPSLGSEDMQAGPDIGRVSSPGLSTAVQSLPVGSSTLIGGEGWTSALVEVPTVIGNSSTGSIPVVQTVASPVSGPTSVLAGLNMAKALAQAPLRTRTAPRLSVQTQRLEELAIKQSRQLIPVTPSMPKILALNSSDKSKPKTVVKSGEMNISSKNVQQQPSLLHAANQSLLGGHVKSDASKTSHGKLFVLKPGWENGASPSPMDVGSPANNASGAAPSQLGAPASVPSATPRSPNNPKPSSGERKSVSLSLISGFNAEKRPSSSQTQSRNDFFNLLKKKNLTNTSAILSDKGSVVSYNSEKSCEVNEEVVSPIESHHSINNGAELTSNGSTCEDVHRISEEEAAFLRSLGWEENSGEDEGLTEEEINSFYQEYMKFRPSPEASRGTQQKLIDDSNVTSLGGTSSEVSSSDSELETC